MTPEVSVLLSVYNAESTVQHCVESILSQTYQDLELVVINDGSSDATEQIIQSFTDHRIRYYSPGRLGLPKALNYGLSKCRGAFIARMDADDWSYPSRIEKQILYLKSNPEIDVVSSLIEYGGDRNRSEGYALHVDWINQLITHEQMYKNRFEEAPLANPSSIFRSELVDKYGNYSEEEIPEDYEFWLRLMHYGVKFGKVQEVLLRWSDLPDRLTRTSDNYSQQAFLKVKAHYLKLWLNKQFKDYKIPAIYVFGTGSSVNTKLKPFLSAGIKIHKRLEVKDMDRYPENTIHYSQLPPASDHNIVLSFIGNRSGKEKIERHLSSIGYIKGETYFMMC